MSIVVMRKIAFDAAHRLLGHEGKCKNLHGHRYVADLHARADALDSVGRVVDFSVLKARVGGWVDEVWDHTAIFHHDDPMALQVMQTPNLKPVFLASFNPTAENLANFLLRDVCPAQLQGTGATVFKVVLHETPNCSATVHLEDDDGHR